MPQPRLKNHCFKGLKMDQSISFFVIFFFSLQRTKPSKKKPKLRLRSRLLPTWRICIPPFCCSKVLQTISGIPRKSSFSDIASSERYSTSTVFHGREKIHQMKLRRNTLLNLIKDHLKLSQKILQKVAKNKPKISSS